MRLVLICYFTFIGFVTGWTQPVNDECWNAIPLNANNGGCIFNATLVNATQSLPAANCNSALIQDIWFSFVADSTVHQVSVSPSSGMDAVLEVRGGACDGAFIVCIDDGGGNGAVEQLVLNNLKKDSLYLIRIYDFTGAGKKPGTWTLDICVSGFEPTVPPKIELLHPKGGEILEAGAILSIEAKVEGVISGKELSFSADNGETWKVIWESSSPNPDFRFDWEIPSINTEKGFIRASVFQLGEAIETSNDTTFTISTDPNPSFRLAQDLSHLYWPFYNPNTFPTGDFHVPSRWQNQENGVLITKDDVVNTWFYFNDHYWQSSGRWHHSGDNCFAQDWNFMNGGNSDCQMYFFSPMEGILLFQKDACLNFNCGNPTCTSGCGNYLVVQSIENPAYVYRACHFSELNPDLVVGDKINAGDWVAKVGNEGSSSAAHVHFVLYKNLTNSDIDKLANGNTLSSNTDLNINPNSITDLCFDKAANFRFDVSLPDIPTSIPSVFYKPIHEIKLYPNPNAGNFKLSVNVSALQFMKIEIFDAIGRKVFEEQQENYQSGEIIPISLSKRIAGVHYVSIRLDQEILRKKFILTK